MFKTLLRKQMLEFNKFYFQDKKTGAMRSKGATVRSVLVFAFLMLIIAGSFFAAGVGLFSAFHPVGLDWLYYFIMAVISVLLGAFGSIFNTYSSLFKAKDNDLLLSLPIKTDAIVASRLVGVYIMGFMYELTVILPALIVAWIQSDFSLRAFLFQLVMVIEIGFIILAISVVLGYVVAVLSSKIHSKAFISVISSLLVLVIYYFCWFKAQSLIETVTKNSEYYGKKIKNSSFFLYNLGNSFTGNVKSLLTVSVLIFVVCALVCFVLRNSFAKLCAGDSYSNKKKKSSMSFTASSCQTAALKRELKHFFSSSAYMMNIGMGFIIMLAIGILALVKSDFLLQRFYETGIKAIEGAIPIYCSAVICSVCTMSSFTSASISLEGNTFWILKSLPLSAKTVLGAKLRAHIVLNTVPAFLGTVMTCIALKYSILHTVLSIATVFLFICFIGQFGLIANLKHYNLVWTNENVPIKQGLSMILTILVGFVLSVVLLSVGMLVSVKGVSINIYFFTVLVVFVMLNTACFMWLNKKGIGIFEEIVM